MLQTVTRAGDRLVAIAVTYVFIALLVTSTFVAAGREPPPLLPGSVVDLFTKTMEAWNSIRGLSFKASVVEQIAAVLNLLINSFQTVLAVIVTIVLVYVWLAIVATSLLPYPLTILAIPIWVAALYATWVITIWLLDRVYQTIRSRSSYYYY